MLVVFIFLGNFKSTFIIVLSIPMALLASLVYLFATGNTLNIISMWPLEHLVHRRHRLNAAGQRPSLEEPEDQRPGC